MFVIPEGGAKYDLPSGGAASMVNGATSPHPQQDLECLGSLQSVPPVHNASCPVEGQTFQTMGTADYVGNGQTLVPVSATTANSTTHSLASGGASGGWRH